MGIGGWIGKGNFSRDVRRTLRTASGAGRKMTLEIGEPDDLIHVVCDAVHLAFESLNRRAAISFGALSAEGVQPGIPIQEACGGEFLAPCGFPLAEAVHLASQSYLRSHNAVLRTPLAG